MADNILRDMRLRTIRHSLEQSAAAHLPARGAVRMLEWAEACGQGRDRADLLALFAVAGGMKAIRDDYGPMQ